jgi:hypothetical protein
LPGVATDRAGQKGQNGLYRRAGHVRKDSATYELFERGLTTIGAEKACDCNVARSLG